MFNLSFILYFIYHLFNIYKVYYSWQNNCFEFLQNSFEVIIIRNSKHVLWWCSSTFFVSLFNCEIYCIWKGGSSRAGFNQEEPRYFIYIEFSW